MHPRKNQFDVVGLIGVVCAMDFKRAPYLISVTCKRFTTNLCGFFIEFNIFHLKDFNKHKSVLRTLIKCLVHTPTNVLRKFSIYCIFKEWKRGRERENEKVESVNSLFGHLLMVFAERVDLFSIHGMEIIYAFSKIHSSTANDTMEPKTQEIIAAKQ